MTCLTFLPKDEPDATTALNMSPVNKTTNTWLEQNGVKTMKDVSMYTYIHVHTLFLSFYFFVSILWVLIGWIIVLLVFVVTRQSDYRWFHNSHWPPHKFQNYFHSDTKSTDAKRKSTLKLATVNLNLSKKSVQFVYQRNT